MGIHGLMNIINDEAPGAVKEAVRPSTLSPPLVGMDGLAGRAAYCLPMVACVCAAHNIVSHAPFSPSLSPPLPHFSLRLQKKLGHQSVHGAEGGD